MGTLWQDLQYGARMLIKARGFTAIAVLSLALGIGANTALFSVVDVLLLKKLPVKEPGRLVLFRSMAPREFSAGSYTGNSSTDPLTGQRTMTSFPYQSFQRLREQESALSDIFAFGNVGLNVSADGQADVASGQAVSGNYFAGLGVQPLLGRVLTEEDDKAAASAAAVLSFRYWKQRFGGNPSVIGKQINLNNVAFTIIGVTPPGFEGRLDAGHDNPDCLGAADLCRPRTLEYERRGGLVAAVDGPLEAGGDSGTGARSVGRRLSSVSHRPSRCAANTGAGFERYRSQGSGSPTVSQPVSRSRRPR